MFNSEAGVSNAIEHMPKNIFGFINTGNVIKWVNESNVLCHDGSNIGKGVR
jgi:hypothetical protein